MPKKKEAKSKKAAGKDDSESRELTTHIEGDLPYSRDAYISQIKLLIRRSVEDVLDAGKRLLILKEKEGHGKFVKIVEDEIGIPTSTAYRFMNAALKAGKFPQIKFEDFSRIGKVYALLEAPEQDLKELEEKGVLAGKNIDELHTMSVLEMRDTIKTLRDNTDEIVKEKTEEIRRENKTLKKELGELQEMVPTSPDGSWAEKPLTMIQEAFIRIDNLLSSFAFDPSIIGNDKLQAKVEGFRVEMEKRAVLFIERWESHTGKKVGK
ncbi:MAG: hypothetical protein FD156_1182 [Nitrospirae bacterium]|nr:MAG: hypothetical protein FD156_1182 [Nitrospirota bacterium]